MALQAGRAQQQQTGEEEGGQSSQFKQDCCHLGYESSYTRILANPSLTMLLQYIKDLKDWISHWKGEDGEDSRETDAQGISLGSLIPSQNNHVENSRAQW